MTTDNSSPSNTNYRWVVLGIVYLTFLAYSIVFQSIPPILSLIVQDLNLSHAEAGLLMGLFALPGLFLPIPVGVLADRYGPRWLVVVCLLSIIVGTAFVAVGRSFSLLALGRVIGGIGGVSLFVVGAHYVSEWFPRRELGVAVGVYSTAFPIGTIISLNTLGVLSEAFGWQGAVSVTILVSIVVLAVFVALYRKSPLPSSGHVHQAHQSFISIVSNLRLPIWLLSFIWMLFNVAVISFITFAPDYFISKGYEIEFAGFLASFLMILSPPLAPLIGYALDRFGHEELFIGVGGLLVAYSVTAILGANSSLILLLMLLSVGNALVPTPVFSLVPKIVRPQYVGAGYGVISTGVNLGVVVGPYVSGLIRDMTGSYQSSFYFMSLMGLSTALFAGALYVLRNRSR